VPVELLAKLKKSQLHMAERVFWWAHIVGVFFFANYVMYSKHLHIFLAFPNAYFARLEPNGKMKNMDAVTNEVKMMLGMQAEGAATPPEEIGRFGAKDVTDLSNKSLLDAFACTECGRCTDECPANLTGKLLSPRKIMMDTRDRAEELEKVTRKDKEATDNKSLLGDYITKEELYACTSCNACVQACPVSINPLDIITELRRYKIMEESDNPQEWNGMYQNIETSFNPWKFPPTDRAKWTENLG
jgi:heterodisulfide reductase subunit C